MKFRYEFVTGEVIEIDVPEKFEKVMIEIDKDICRCNRRETMRHTSLEVLQRKGVQLSEGPSGDVVSMLVKQERREVLINAISNLLPQQRELVRKVFFERRTMADIAPRGRCCRKNYSGPR